jgi:hypothetical protein
LRRRSENPGYTTSSVLGTAAATAAAGTGAANGVTPLSAASTVSTLPFTGVSIFFLVLSAITLILMGAALLRIGRTLTTRESVA